MKTLVVLIMLMFTTGLLVKPAKSVSEKKSTSLVIPTQKIQTGDLILRSGKGLISEIFTKTSRKEKKYSHAGIVVKEKDKFYVYHMIGSQTSGSNGLIKESLDDFCDQNLNFGFAVYRYKSLKGLDFHVTESLMDLSKSAPLFDEAFDLETDDYLYCTEMIYKMVLSVSGYKLPVSTLNSQNYIAIDDLYHNDNTTQIISLKY